MDNSKNNNATSYFIENVLYHFIEWFKRLWIFILIFAVIGSAGLSFLTYYRFVPSYSASATFTVNVDVRESSSQTYNKATAQQLASTFPSILTSSSLNKVIASDLGVDKVNASISATALEDTNLFTINVTSSNPQMAYDVLQSVIANYPKVAKFVIGSTQLSLIDTSSVSTMPTNIPNYTKKAIMGALAGGMVAFMLIVLLSLMTNTVIRGDDISNYFNTTCLGSIAELHSKKRSKDKTSEIPDVQNVNVNYRFREGIFTIRNSVIRKCKDKGYKSIVVTSTISGEGKSITALNLAKAIALKGYKTCLVDFDLRVPSIADYMEIDEDVKNVSDYIRGNVDIKSCVYKTRTENFYIAVERKNNSDASELVGDEKAKEFIQKLCEYFEFVIIDSPPIGYLADASVISDYADAAVYVVAQDICSRRSINQGLHIFDGVNAEVLGCVLNRITKGMESENYGKYTYRRYGKYGRYGYHGKYGYSKGTSYGTVTDATIEENFNGIEFEEE